ncbi:chromate transporter [Chitinivibrio alkaliphilus]|uniref:Chromate transporter n=1 Tax=Chitinivibrio alkaliphilus ACht1 TaxID=1313304 RepID=U7D5E3_9BACT|nr:chromate transporter [Chitinivibrio alkaliphilus]ERP31739.1 Chromate transporter [Chitinivibrio alkaliphilus ACht1]
MISWTSFVGAFFLMGLSAYGGGMAIISLIQKEVVDRHQWLTFSEMSHIITISEMTPGPIAVNIATFTGYTQGHFSGAVIATVALLLPSQLILLALLSHRENKEGGVSSLVHYMAGIEIGVLALIASAAWTFSRRVIEGVPELVLFMLLLALFFLVRSRINPVWIIGLGGILGALFFV